MSTVMQRHLIRKYELCSTLFDEFSMTPGETRGTLPFGFLESWKMLRVNNNKKPEPTMFPNGLADITCSLRLKHCACWLSLLVVIGITLMAVGCDTNRDSEVETKADLLKLIKRKGNLIEAGMYEEAEKLEIQIEQLQAAMLRKETIEDTETDNYRKALYAIKRITELDTAGSGKYEETLGLIERLEDAMPNSADLSGAKAIILARLDKVQEYKKALIKAESLGVYKRRLYFHIGTALLDAGKSDEGTTFLLKSLNADSLTTGKIDASLLSKLGRRLERAGLITEAFDAFVQAYKMRLNEASGLERQIVSQYMVYVDCIFSAREDFEATKICSLLAAQALPEAEREAQGIPTLSQEEIEERINELRIRLKESCPQKRE